MAEDTKPEAKESPKSFKEFLEAVPPFYSMLSENTAVVTMDDYTLDSLPDREPTTIQSSCMELWRDVLLDLFYCRTAHFQGSNRQRKVDREWIMSSDTEAGSFLWTCSHLGLDHVAILLAYQRGLDCPLG
jgi:hypothetical protein